jgi:predicted aspartyl protease
MIEDPADSPLPTGVQNLDHFSTFGRGEEAMSIRELLSIAAAISALSPAIAAPLKQLPSGLFATGVTVNGTGPWDFIVDTGASLTIVTPSLRDRLSLVPGSRTVQAHGASGAAAVPLFKLDTLAVDGRSRSSVSAAEVDNLVDSPQVQGILGTDFLSSYIVEMDLPNGLLKLHETEASISWQRRWAEVPFSSNQKRHIILSGSLDGSPITILLDSAAHGTIINWQAARQAGVALTDKNLSPGFPIRDAFGNALHSSRRDFQSLKAGELNLDAHDITIADLPVFPLLDLEDRPAMILGIDRLQHLRIVINYPAMLLRVENPSQAAAK